MTQPVRWNRKTGCKSRRSWTGRSHPATRALRACPRATHHRPARLSRGRDAGSGQPSRPAHAGGRTRGDRALRTLHDRPSPGTTMGCRGGRPGERRVGGTVKQPKITDRERLARLLQYTALSDSERTVFRRWYDDLTSGKRTEPSARSASGSRPSTKNMTSVSAGQMPAGERALPSKQNTRQPPSRPCSYPKGPRAGNSGGPATSSSSSISPLASSPTGTSPRSDAGTRGRAVRPGPGPGAAGRRGGRARACSRWLRHDARIEDSSAPTPPHAA
jgi:hypothetical protein